MKSAERILASDDVEEKGLCLAFLKERYTKAALLKFSLDRAVIPYLIGELWKVARILSVQDHWAKQTKIAAPFLIRIAMIDLERGGRTTVAERVVFLEAMLKAQACACIPDEGECMGWCPSQKVAVSERTWYRHYSKPYESLYGELCGWAYAGRRHVFRRENAEELDDDC